MKHLTTILISILCLGLFFYIAQLDSHSNIENHTNNQQDNVIILVDTSYNYEMEEFNTYTIPYELGFDERYPIHIKYKQPVNGFMVSVTWYTLNSIYCSDYYGFATIKFMDENHNTFYVSNEAFHIEEFYNIMNEFYSSSIYLPDKSTITNIKTKVFLLDYATNPHPQDSLDYQAPFFFSDVDFDGRQELVVTLYQTGQRFVNEYKVYKFGYHYGYIGEVKEKPYTLFDDFTSFDYENKKVSIYHSAGVMYSYEDIYQYSDSSYLPLVYEKSIYYNELGNDTTGMYQ